MLACSLGKTTINDATRRRVHRLFPIIKHEEALVDALVHEHHCHLRLHGSLVGHELFNRLLELGQLELNDLVTLGITNTVTVDDEVCGEHATVVLSENFHGIVETVVKAVFHHLVALLLDNVVRIVLTHVLVDGG